LLTIFSCVGAFGSSNTGFGAAKPAFGAATTGAGGGLFGSSTTTSGGTGFGSGFGTNTAATSSPFGGGTTNSLFGANKTSTPFGGGNNTTTGTGTSMFGGGSAFGGGNNTTSAFGGATNNPGIGTNVGDPPGTAVLAFSPYLDKEPNSTAQNSFQNILFQEPYKKFSAEELRMADYAQGRQYGNGPAGGGGAFGASSGFGGGFGNNTTQNTGFGNTNTGTGLFSNAQNNTGTTGFGATTNTSGFGSGTTGGGLFGQNKPATGGSLFGNTTATSQPAQAGGLFGSTGGTTGGFGTANTTTTGFGGNTGGGLFAGTQNKPATTTTGFGGGFGGGTTGTGFGTNPGTSTSFGQNNTTNTGGGLFNNATTQQNTSGGGLFGNNTQQQPQNTGFGTGAFGQNTTQQSGGGLFGNQNKPAATTGGLFNNTGTQNAGGGLFGNNNTNNTGAFGQNTTQQQGGGGLFGNANKPATGGGLFGGTTGQTGQTGGGLFGGLGTNTQAQPQQTGTTPLFGGLGGNQTQNRPSLFGQTGQSTGGGLFGNQTTQQSGGGLFGQSTAQQPQQNALGNSLFGTSQNSQPGPQALTASIGDVNAYGTPSLFSGLGNGEVQNPGPLATPLSGKKKERKGSILPMWKLNPSSSTRFNTPVKRGFGFTYSTYGSPATPSSAGSTPGGFGQSLLGTGNLNRSISKSVSSSNLRKSFNAEDSILTPGSFSSSMGTRPYGTSGLKKLNIDKSLRLDLFSSPSRDKQLLESPGPRKLPKRVSFDTSIDTSENGTLDGAPSTPSTSAQDLGFIRPTNGGTVTTNGGSKSPETQPEMEQVRGNELAIVHEESSAASAPQDTGPSPSKEAGAYWMSPSKEEILKMNRIQRSQVPNFTVGRENVGQVQFKTPVDLNNIDLDEIPGGIVVLETRSCTVYPVAARKPQVGKGLNVPSEISLEHSWPRGRDKRTPIPEKSGRAFNKHVERLKKIPDTKFIDYNAETGVWTFEVEHFTTYGLDYDEEDTDGDTFTEAAPEDAALPAPPAFSFQVEHGHPESDDAFEFRRKRRALPGAFDYTGAVSDEEEEMADANEQSFLSNRSAGSLSKALEHHEDELMDEEHALPEAQDTSAYLGYHQAAEPDYDSPYHGSMAEYQETPGGIMRARMRAIKDSNAPFKLQVADGDEWMDMLQKTIGPAKRDRAALKAINEDETYDDLKASIRQYAPQAKPRAVADGRGFATSIELMNSLFEKPKAHARPAQAPIPTSGFKVGTTSVC
jgi:nuclear pore complex protein Nup98-Nup96